MAKKRNQQEKKRDKNLKKIVKPPPKGNKSEKEIYRTIYKECRRCNYMKNSLKGNMKSPEEDTSEKMRNMGVKLALKKHDDKNISINIIV
ncbi:hypothetical protein C5167_029299 [Papaver somniferum]|nr:hypothetical protein C5167_029299 [Papaver somniferum]